MVRIDPEEHPHAVGARHSHPHADGEDNHHHHHHDHESSDHVHVHGGEHRPHTSVVELNAKILARNDAAAERNRAWLAGREILALNLMSAPGAGKTALLERTIAELKARHAVFVLEGDQATDRDGVRAREAGAHAVQINTGRGCHLDAEMVAHGIRELRPRPGSLLFIENVGNLVCPALFDLGERHRIALLSVAEGDDKPLKYPDMFRRADLVLLNKIDLLPYVDFDMDRAVAGARAAHPEVQVLAVSARTGEGFTAWLEWVEAQLADVRASPFA
jgi:hydrogenase nickel incorporation protein HypB